MEIIGIRMKWRVGSIANLKKKKFKRREKMPMKKAVIIESEYVARTFSNHDLLENAPITKSREVLAINGPLKLPLRDNRAGTIKIRTRKLAKCIIKSDRIIPAKRSPTIETISDGKVSLIILPLESCDTIYHPHQIPLILIYLYLSFLIIVYGNSL
jgi:hypothetical protein